MTKFGIQHFIVYRSLHFLQHSLSYYQNTQVLSTQIEFYAMLNITGCSNLQLLARAQTSFFNQPVNLIIFKTVVVLPSQFFQQTSFRFFLVRGRSQTTLTRFWLFFDHLPPCVDIFYGTNVDKKWTFLDHIPTSSCKRSL